MSNRIWLVSVVLVFAAMLSGCGAKKATVEEKKAPPPAAPEGPKGLGVSQKDLLKGFDNMVLEQLEGKSPVGGNVYKGGTGDGPTKATNMIVYGTPELVTGVYGSFNLPYIDFPDAAKAPDYMQRNAKYLDALLTNIFGSVPADVKAGIEWAKTNPDKTKTVEVNGKNVKITYSVDKTMGIDVR